MISMEVFMDIFALRRQGFSVRYIAKKLGIHRNTVKKDLESGSPPQYRKKKRAVSILDPFKQDIDAFLEHDSYQATWIFDRIRNMGYRGSYDTVKNYVHKVKERLNKLAYIRFETETGVQAQVDWADFQVRIHFPCFCNDSGLFPGHVCEIRRALHPPNVPGLPYPRIPFSQRGAGRNPL